MGDETKVPSKEDQGAVTLNEESLKALAAVVKSVAAEEIQSIFGGDLGAAVLKAREDINRTDALKATVSSKKRQGAGTMDLAQQGEWLRCRITGEEPDQELDVGGCITQALGPTVDSKGGYAVPTDVQLGVIKKADEPAIIWPEITKRNTNREAVTKREVTGYVTPNQGTAAKSGSTVTADTIAETEPTWGELTWTQRYFDVLYYAKIDLLEDSPDDIMQELIDLAGDGFAIKHEYHSLQGPGSGSSLPQGIMTTSGIDTIPFGGAPTVSNILALMAAVPQRYRSRAKAVMDGTILYATLEELALNVRSAQFLVDRIPEMLESEWMDSDKILVGDLTRYVAYINRLMYLVQAVSPKGFSQEIAIVEKWDGQVTIKDAFRIATGVTTGS